MSRLATGLRVSSSSSKSSKTKAKGGTKLAFQFSRYRVLAKALIIGDVETTCTPKPQPFTLATATVIAKP